LVILNLKVTKWQESEENSTLATEEKKSVQLMEEKFRKEKADIIKEFGKKILYRNKAIIKKMKNQAKKFRKRTSGIYSPNNFDCHEKFLYIDQFLYQ
jgi:hypothetical protein